ncbi:hypothetical protein C0995_016121 [Termitomyces sp. Mi166|nr:hypothetical protein C0995_016121 [Termitomyces sp. Mi166\
MPVKVLASIAALTIKPAAKMELMITGMLAQLAALKHGEQIAAQTTPKHSSTLALAFTAPPPPSSS